MTNTFDPSELFRPIEASLALPHYQAAIDALQCVDSHAWRDRLISFLHAAALEFRANYAPTPQTAAMHRALEAITAGLLSIEAGLEVLHDARKTAPTNAPDRAAVLTALFPAVIEALLPQHGPFDWDETERFHAPLRGEHRRMAARVTSIADQLRLRELPTATRPTSPAVDRLINRLGDIYSDVTGLPPSATINSKLPDYDSPFTRFVKTFWPAVADDISPENQLHAPPSAWVIGQALSRKED